MNVRCLVVALAPTQPATLERAWYSPDELLPVVTGRESIRWVAASAFRND